MVHLKLLTSMLFSVSCLSVALASLKFRTKPVIPASELEVTNNFQHLLNVIRNDTKWLAKILFLIKLERNRRKSTKNGICEWCLDPYGANHTEQSPRQPNLRRTGTEGVIPPQFRQMLTQLFLDKIRLRRVRRSVISTLLVPRSKRTMKTNEREQAFGTEYGLIDFEGPVIDQPVDELPESMNSDKLKASKRSRTISRERNNIRVSRSSTTTASPTTTHHPTTTSRRTNSESYRTLEPGDYRYRSRKTDNKGATVRSCTPAEGRHYCQNEGQCIVVSVVEFKTCRCDPGFTGRRCENFAFLDVVETMSNHSEITSIDEIEDPNENKRMKSSLRAVAIYTVTAYSRSRHRF